MTERRGILRSLHHIFGVVGDEGAAMLIAEHRIDDDLPRLEILGDDAMRGVDCH